MDMQEVDADIVGRYVEMIDDDRTGAVISGQIISADLSIRRCRIEWRDGKTTSCRIDSPSLTTF